MRGRGDWLRGSGGGLVEGELGVDEKKAYVKGDSSVVVLRHH